MRIFWLGLVAVGLVAEAFALITNRDTLSSTWFWLRDLLPVPVALLLSAALGALFLWLLSVHWLFAGVDRPGFDLVERAFVTIGAGIGLVGGFLSYKRRKQ